MRFLIVEDLRATSEMIRKMIQDLVKGDVIIDQAFTFDQAKSKIMSNNYDILFLDITLPRGNTFDLLDELTEEKKRAAEIIFLTGHDTKEYFLNAIKHSASGYVLKPIDLNDFKEAMDKCLRNLNQASSKEQQDGPLTTPVLSVSNIPISLARGAVTVLPVDEISHLVGEGSLTKVHVHNEETLTSVKNLGYYKGNLIENFGFLIASKSVIVNPAFIEIYKPILQEINLKNHVKIRCSRRGGRNLKEWFNSMNK